VNVGLSQKLKKGQLYKGGVKLEWDMSLSLLRLWNGWTLIGVWFGL